MSAGLQTTPFFEGAFQCVQPVRGYRFSADALLLSAFVLSGREPGQRFLDVGAGCGVISLLLAAGGWPRGAALELQEELVECCRQTMAANGLAGRVRVEKGDVRALKGIVEPGSFDAVVSNPPYFPAEAGRLNDSQQEVTARHEVACTMDDVLSAARFALPEGGRLFVTYPAVRLSDLFALLPRHKLKACRLRCVHPLPGREASSVLVEAVKSRPRDLVVEAPLYAHRESGGYAEWFDELRCAVVARV